MYTDNRSLLVKDIMSFPVITATAKESVKSIALKMKSKKISSVVIVDESNVPIGIVTQGDIVNKLIARTKNLLFAKAKNVMSSPVITIKGDVTLENAANTMAKNRIKKLCVTDNEGKLIGIITEEDIVKNASSLIDVLREIINTGYVKEGE
ncbi:MAG: CBS domain-containing protein [Candidatus Micrarchaeaceae archaeon]